ncbi:uncharacterized protein SETTUDRAFT_21246 [Exserohilum turcica Et28A]|uniref:Uncharacterized protein n=1 Tax=Exserohilum turcicum (strain 28A) TaxID=671987 RepID=R0IF37_EXST2|nr:uncharacterized protein SETTUDRAFT_21246 [Exserohilum turcica Et28A]EOA83900.1 hypothetical protein SETTUDRAFT_21246 [Exserohilum turcica Et28A]
MACDTRPLHDGFMSVAWLARYARCGLYGESDVQAGKVRVCSVQGRAVRDGEGRS